MKPKASTETYKAVDIATHLCIESGFDVELESSQIDYAINFICTKVSTAFISRAETILN